MRKRIREDNEFKAVKHKNVSQLFLLSLLKNRCILLIKRTVVVLCIWMIFVKKK